MRTIPLVTMRACWMVLLLSILSPRQGFAYCIDESDGHCCSSNGTYHVNVNSFLSRTNQSLAFPNQYAVHDQAALAARFWNEAGAKMNFLQGSDTTSYFSAGSIQMVDGDDPELGGAVGYGHWSSSLCSCGPSIAITRWYVVLNGDPPQGTNISKFQTSWSPTAFGQWTFFKILAHELGLTMGLGHSNECLDDTSYVGNLMYATAQAVELSRLTEDDASAIIAMKGKNSEPLRFFNASFTAWGMGSWSTLQVVNDANHLTSAQPAIASNMLGGLPFDFAVAWRRASDQALAVELVNVPAVGSTQQTYQGPFFFAPGSYSNVAGYQSPSVAVADDGRVMIATRYEGDNPPSSELQDFNESISVIVSDPTHTSWHQKNLDICGEGNGRWQYCRAISSPQVTYSTYTHRWVIAFTASNHDQLHKLDPNGGPLETHAVLVLVSDDATGWNWTSPPLRMDHYSAYAAPAVTCADPWLLGWCLLIYQRYDGTGGRSGSVYQTAFRVGGSDPSHLYEVPEDHFSLGVHGVGHVNVAAGSNGWVFNRITDPTLSSPSITYKHRPMLDGIGSSFQSDHGFAYATPSQQGHSVACVARADGTDLCRFAYETN